MKWIQSQRKVALHISAQAHIIDSVNEDTARFLEKRRLAYISRNATERWSVRPMLGQRVALTKMETAYPTLIWVRSGMQHCHGLG